MMEQTDIRPLIDTLIGVMRSNGSLKSAAVEQVFRDVPRHLFLPDEPLEEILVYFYTWLAVRSPDGFPTFSAAGEAVEAVIPIALIAVKGQEKWVRTLLKVLPDGAAVITRPPDAVIDWIDPEQSEEEREPEQPFEVYIQQLGPGPEAAQFLVRMLQAWDAAGRPNSSKMHLRGIPAENPQQTPGQMQEGECLIERPWTNFVVWYQD